MARNFTRHKGGFYIICRGISLVNCALFCRRGSTAVYGIHIVNNKRFDGNATSRGGGFRLDESRSTSSGLLRSLRSHKASSTHTTIDSIARATYSLIKCVGLLFINRRKHLTRPFVKGRARQTLLSSLVVLLSIFDTHLRCFVRYT